MSRIVGVEQCPLQGLRRVAPGRWRTAATAIAVSLTISLCLSLPCSYRLACANAYG